MKALAIIAIIATAYFVRYWLLAGKLAKADRWRSPAEKERSRTEVLPNRR